MTFSSWKANNVSCGKLGIKGIYGKQGRTFSMVKLETPTARALDLESSVMAVR